MNIEIKNIKQSINDDSSILSIVAKKLMVQ